MSERKEGVQRFQALSLPAPLLVVLGLLSMGAGWGVFIALWVVLHRSVIETVFGAMFDGLVAFGFPSWAAGLSVGVVFSLTLFVLSYFVGDKLLHQGIRATTQGLERLKRAVLRGVGAILLMVLGLLILGTGVGVIIEYRLFWRRSTLVDTVSDAMFDGLVALGLPSWAATLFVLVVLVLPAIVAVFFSFFVPLFYGYLAMGEGREQLKRLKRSRKRAAAGSADLSSRGAGHELR